jgi:hypothetical protein
LLALISAQANGGRGLGLSDLRAALSLWGEVDAGDPEEDKRVDGDVTTAHVEGATARGRLRMRLGRQLLVAGVGRATPFDGLFMDARLVSGVGLSIHGGVPVTPRLSIDRGDGTWGARLAYRHHAGVELGASYLHILDDGEAARFDLGADARVARGALTYGGGAVLAAAELRLAEAKLYAHYSASQHVRLSLDAARTAPDLFLPRTSILAVFAHHTRDQAGAALALCTARAPIRIEAAGHLLRTEDGLGARGTLRADVTRPPGRAGAELRALRMPGDGYLHARLFGRLTTEAGSSGSLELSLYALDQPRAGQRLAGSATASWLFDLHANWRVVASARAATDPLYVRRFELMVRVAKDIFIERGLP